MGYLGGFGASPDEVLQDVIDFWGSRSDGRGKGAAGTSSRGRSTSRARSRATCSRCRFLSLRTRAPYGINNTGPTSGVFGSGYPGTLRRRTEPDGHAGDAALHPDGRRGRPRRWRSSPPASRCRWRRSWGVMAVAPENPTVGQPGVTVSGVQASRPPGPFGGNLDVKDLAAGSTLYLPVFHAGRALLRGRPALRAGATAR